MTEEDFENNFMVITAIENTSMLGLTVDKVEADENNLYISLIHYDEEESYNEDETCISYKISKKDENFIIEQNTPEINFSAWTNLGENFYSIVITDYSEYLKYMNNYNAPNLNWYDFENICVMLVVRTSSNNEILLNGIIEEYGKEYLNISLGEINSQENFKYSALFVALPNYRSLEENAFLIDIDIDDLNSSDEYYEDIINLDTNIFLTDIKNYNPESDNILITENEAKEIATYGFEESASRISAEGANNVDSETLKIDEVSPNNYFIRKNSSERNRT